MIIYEKILIEFELVSLIFSVIVLIMYLTLKTNNEKNKKHYK
jgi:hypothetical protein